MITSAFSHHEIWHVAANGYVFWSIAPLVMRILGNTQFIGLYAIGEHPEVIPPSKSDEPFLHQVLSLAIWSL